MGRPFVVAFVFATSLTTACRPAPRSADLPTVPPRAIVLVSIDTLRSDHLPAYGYAGVATPHLDAFRRDAVLFHSAYTHVPLTVPAHASILSGLLPTRHGVRDNAGYRFDATAHPYLPVLLRARGYATGAAVSAYVLRGRDTGLGAGFDWYEDRIRTRVGRGLSGLQRAGRETLLAALEWTRRAAASGPFFLFLHLYEPHAPYAPPPHLAARYPLLYDGEIAAVDEVLGELFGALRAMALYDDALVVVLSDHGEGLGEHGEDGHGVFLYRHDLQVPLLVKLPGGARAGDRVEATVGLVAVAPTILAAAGIEVPAAMVGRSLFAARDRGDSGIYAETYTPRFHFGWSELVSWIRGPHQYIHGPDPELFDLGSDPAQTHNLIAEERRLAHDLRSILERQLSPPEPPAAVDEEARAALAALGYAGGVSSRRLGSSRELPDPKRMVHTLRDLHAGLEQYAAGRPQEAAATLRRAVTASPDLVDAWDYLGRSYQRLRQFDRAIAAFREALDRSERAPEAAIGAAISLVEVGRPTEALLVVRAERQRDPHDLRLGLLEGRLLLSLGRTVEAERLAQETLQQGPDDADALYQMGAVKMATRDLVEAEQYFRRALAIAPEHPAASSDLDVLIRAQRIAGSGSR